MRNPQQLTRGSMRLSRLLVRLAAEARELRVDVANLSPGMEDPEPIFIVHDPIKRLLKEADLISVTFCPEDFRLDEISFVPPEIPKIDYFVVASNRSGALS